MSQRSKRRIFAAVLIVCSGATLWLSQYDPHANRLLRLALSSLQVATSGWLGLRMWKRSAARRLASHP